MFPSFEYFPENNKEYKRRLGFAIITAVLTYSSNILVGVIGMRFRNDNQSKEGRRPDRPGRRVTLQSTRQE